MLGNKKVMGNNIQKYMDICGLSRKEFAERIKEPYSSVTDWINGKSYPRIDKIQKMADFFGIEKACLVEDHANQSDKPQRSKFEESLIEAFWNAPTTTQQGICVMLSVHYYNDRIADKIS